MSNGLSWLERHGSLNWRNREILSQKIKQLGADVDELMSNTKVFLKLIQELGVQLQHLCDKKRLAANDVVRLNKIQEKIVLYSTLIQEAQTVLQEAGGITSLSELQQATTRPFKG